MMVEMWVSVGEERDDQDIIYKVMAEDFYDFNSSDETQLQQITSHEISMQDDFSCHTCASG